MIFCKFPASILVSFFWKLFQFPTFLTNLALQTSSSGNIKTPYSINYNYNFWCIALHRYMNVLIRMNGNLNDNILLGFQQGNEKAFRQLFDYYYPSLFNFAKKLTGDSEEAKDIVSFTFHRLFEKYDKFQTEGNIKAFLFITARNNSLNYLNSKKARTSRELEYVRKMNDDTLLEYDHEITDILVDKLNEAINNLPEQCGRIFKMLYCQQMKPDDVAKILSISVNTVYVQKNRALNTLRLMFGRHSLVVAWLLCLLSYT